MNRIELARVVGERCRGKPTILPWGQPTGTFDRKALSRDPKLLAEICRQMTDDLPDEIEIIAGIGRGGIDFAKGIAQRSGRKLIILEKDGSGKLFLEKGLILGRGNVLLVDDTVCKGEKAVLAKNLINNNYLECQVRNLSVVVDRGNVYKSRLEQNGIKVRTLFSGKELMGTR